MKQRAEFWLLFVGLIAVALWLRCGDLSRRPLHNDEAINAFKLRTLWTGGTYRYDPHEFHGPTLYYLSLPVLGVAARVQPDQPDETSMRVVPLLFGIGLILLLPFVSAGLGRPATLWSGLFAAVSPAFVYFSRYYIHEILLVFFTGLVLVALWRYRCRPGWGAALTAGAGVGLMYATKETFVFALGAMGAGFVAAALGPGAEQRTELRTGIPDRLRALGRGLARVPRWHWVGGALAGAAAAGLFFTSFLANPAGALDAVRTYLIWFERAGGATPHVHPWDFYFERLLWFHLRGGPIWTEAAVLGLAVVGIVTGWRGTGAVGAGGELTRFLAGFSLTLAAIYAVLPYKTPWCLLGFYHGLILLAGIGVAWLGEISCGRVARVAVIAVVLAASAHLAVQAWRATREFAADFRNPHVYGHTSADIENLLGQVRELAGVHPAGRGLPMTVAAPEDNYWPLPWYLRDFANTGWGASLPEPATGSVIIVAAKLKAGLEERTRGAWVQAGMFELRPRYFVELYVEAELWRKFLAARAANRGG